MSDEGSHGDSLGEGKTDIELLVLGEGDEDDRCDRYRHMDLSDRVKYIYLTFQQRQEAKLRWPIICSRPSQRGLHYKSTSRDTSGPSASFSPQPVH